MVVGNHERGLRFVGNVVDALFPSDEFIRLVEIVVAVGTRFSFEPLIVIAPVQPYIADRRSHMRGGFERTPDLWLIDIAEAHVAFGEIRYRLRIAPGRMPDFD